MPEWMIQLHRRLPLQPPSWVFCLLLNHILPRYGSALSVDEGQCIELEILDYGLRERVIYRLARFVPAGQGAGVNVRIAARSADLLAMARREEDADTLFFRRLLVIEGDTELGLRIKNWLDTLEWPAWIYQH